LIPYDSLPAVNAGLNALCAVLLLIGFAFIRSRNVAAHRRTMKTAFVVSVLFLVSYLTYHSHAGVHRYPGTGAVRSVYLAILATHTVLAAAVVPLVLRTLHLANRGRFIEHRRIARWTLPIWFYVSVTGVVVYLMLYRPLGSWRGDPSSRAGACLPAAGLTHAAAGKPRPRAGRPVSRRARASPRLTTDGSERHGAIASPRTR